MRQRWAWIGAAWLGGTACGSGPVDPTPETEPIVEAPPVPERVVDAPEADDPAPAPETKAQRRARLNREADIRAGLEPGKPLPKWDLSAIEPSEPPPDPACAVGDIRHIEVVLGQGALVRTSVEALEVGPAHVSELDGLRVAHPAISVARLVAGGTGDLTAVACDGKARVIAAAELTDETRWLLVRNKKGRVKLIDRDHAQSAVQPRLIPVTRLQRNAKKTTDTP